jgi:RNA polymerase sigma-70 factor, ECF subfamily
MHPRRYLAASSTAIAPSRVHRAVSGGPDSGGVIAEQVTDQPDGTGAILSEGHPGVDQKVLAALEGGNRELALTLLMQEYGPAVHRYCAGFLRRRYPADDLLQTVFIDAFEALRTYEGKAGFRVWLLAIARHRCLDQLRKTKRFRSFLGEMNAEEVNQASSSDDPDLGPALHDCLGRLPAAMREAVTLRFQQDLSYLEISHLTGSSAGALRVRMFRAMDSLRRCLEKKGGIA